MACSSSRQPVRCGVGFVMLMLVVGTSLPAPAEARPPLACARMNVHTSRIRLIGDNLIPLGLRPNMQLASLMIHRRYKHGALHCHTRNADRSLRRTCAYDHAAAGHLGSSPPPVVLLTCCTWRGGGQGGRGRAAKPCGMGSRNASLLSVDSGSYVTLAAFVSPMSEQPVL